MRHSIVPPYLLLSLAAVEDPALAEAAAAARRSLTLDEPFRGIRIGENPPPGAPPVRPRPTASTRKLEGPQRTVYDAKTTETLPGSVVRREAQDPVADAAVNEAYDGLGATHALYRDVYKRASIDDENLALHGVVHYGVKYDNAFWDGTQMVFGDGDGTVFTGFTSSISVIGHELTHGVTQFTANLAYSGQSGALNESVSDVFGALVEQYTLKQSADQASWLIGAGLFTDTVKGVALRSMKAPGTAYDDPMLGKDPQPATMEGYVTTTDDNGGVHLNSGIPNHAFYLAATAIGGNAWEKAGQLWYDTLTGGILAPAADFAAFAGATLTAATARYGADSAEHAAVASAWTAVGITATESFYTTPLSDTSGETRV